MSLPAAGEEMAYYYTRDHLGSVRELVNGSGSIVARYSYDPYGRTTLVSGANLATFQYAHYFVHITSGLYLAKLRIYDSNTGRWFSKDPSEEEGGINLYQYVSNQPERKVDPFGLCADGDFQPVAILIQFTANGKRPLPERWTISILLKTLAIDLDPVEAAIVESKDQIIAAIDETYGVGYLFNVYVRLDYNCCCHNTWQIQFPMSEQVQILDSGNISIGGPNTYNSNTAKYFIKDDLEAAEKSLLAKAKKHCSDKYGSQATTQQK